jgi:hypothetical protein
MTNKALTQGRLIQFIQLSAIIHLQDEHSITITRYAEQSIILSLNENHTWTLNAKDGRFTWKSERGLWAIIHRIVGRTTG